MEIRPDGVQVSQDDCTLKNENYIICRNAMARQPTHLFLDSSKRLKHQDIRLDEVYPVYLFDT